MGLVITKLDKPEPQGDPTHPPRDYWGRPKVLLPDGSKREPYTRTSSAGSILEDTEALTKWKSRLAAYGAWAFPEVADKAFAELEDIETPEAKKVLNDTTAALQDLAGASAKAVRGTTFHELSEARDQGQDMSFVSPQLLRMLDQYDTILKRMKDELGYEVVDTELFGVNDRFKLAGSMDRVVRLEGKLRIVDIKTSGSMDFSVGKFAMQTLGYAGMKRYNELEALQGIDHGHGIGRSLICHGEEIEQDKAYILWIPQTGENAQLGEIRIDAAVEGFRLADEVREWRNMWKRKAFKFKPVLSVGKDSK